MSTDFRLSNLHGSVVILHVESGAAERWVDEHIAADAMMWGRNGIVIEPRYLANILDGIVDDGLTVRT
jgi:hypothetical protein